MRFSKWHALGNAYLLVERAELDSSLGGGQARALCDYHTGVGADGVLEVVSVSGPEAEVLIWNPDGSTAELSGNGARIAALWLARRAGVAHVRLRIGDRLLRARIDGGQVEIDLGDVEVGWPEMLDVDGEQIEVTPVTVGNPHAVVRREAGRDELLRLGPLIERHPRFPQRTNVQLAHSRGPNELDVLVWERGAGETLSSGSSSVAAASAAITQGWCGNPARVHLPGGVLEVDLRGTRAHLTGPAAEIFRGELADDFRLGSSFGGG
jgi:diaminopimelate epimerase